jgi:hypothetical protein
MCLVITIEPNAKENFRTAIMLLLYTLNLSILSSVEIYYEASLHYLKASGTVVASVSPNRTSTILFLLIIGN